MNPTAPTGTIFGIDAVRAFARAIAPATLLVDETYVLFAGRDCLSLALEEPNVVVSRSFSKAWSLAGLRVGVLVGSEENIGAIYKVKDSYNVDALAQELAIAALSDPEWMQANVDRILATRDRFAAALRERGWFVQESHRTRRRGRRAAAPAASSCAGSPARASTSSSASRSAPTRRWTRSSRSCPSRPVAPR